MTEAALSLCRDDLRSMCKREMRSKCKREMRSKCKREVERGCRREDTEVRWGKEKVGSKEESKITKKKC